MMKMMMMVGVAVAGLTTGVFAQSKPKVTIVNNTGFTAYGLYISPASATSWEEDVLGSDGILSNDRRVTVTLASFLSEEKYYDIRLKDKDGDTYSKYKVNVEVNSTIYFELSDLDAKEQTGTPRNNNTSVREASGQREAARTPQDNDTKIPCVLCSGTGKMLCTICRGMGKEMRIVMGTVAYVTCGSGIPGVGCGGTKKARCGFCGGTGVYDEAKAQNHLAGQQMTLDMMKAMAPNAGSSSVGSGSSSGTSTSRRSTSSCNLCNGTGQYLGDYRTDYTGNGYVKSWCAICQQTMAPHSHKKCPSCNGSGRN